MRPGLEINAQCFIGSKIKTITIPSSVTKMAQQAFLWCEKLEEIIINAKITYLADSIFSHCISLKELRVPDSVKSIEENAMYGCRVIEMIFIPKGVERIESGAFSAINGGCEIIFENGSGLKYENKTIMNSEGTKIIAYIGEETGMEIIIKKEIEIIGKNAYKDKQIRKIVFEEGSRIKEIEMNGLSGHLIESIELPWTIEVIGVEGFIGCSKLSNVRFLANLENSEYRIRIINSSAFSGCPIEAIEIPPSVEEISDEAFKNCDKLREVNFIATNMETRIRKLGAECFYGTGIDEMDIPTECDYIGKNCFKSSKLRLLRFEKNTKMKTIPKQAFSGCLELTTISFGGIQSIGESTFENCQKLVELHLSSSIENISMYSFSGCSKLETITIKGNSRLNCIEGFAFMNCPKLTKFILVDNPNFVTSEDGGVLYDANMERIIIYLPNSPKSTYVAPKTIRKVEAYCFASASNIANLSFLESEITSIGFSAFMKCLNLEYVFLPSTLREIGNLVFNDCPSLHCGSIIYPPHLYGELIKANTAKDVLDPCPTLYFTLTTEPNNILSLMSLFLLTSEVGEIEVTKIENLVTGNDFHFNEWNN